MTTTIRRAEKSDPPALLRHFSAEFGASDPAPLWDWKYDAKLERGRGRGGAERAFTP
jgi:hypothetical protein